MTSGVIEGGYTGYWGPRTSLLDWCELNYDFVYWIAEFYNTVSNLSFIGLGLLGAYRSRKQGFERRFMWAYLSVSMVGFGSAWFHGTLKYHSQLADELPMLVCMACIWYCTLPTEKMKQRDVKLYTLLMTLYILLVTAAYVYTSNPLVHQVGYGLVVAVLLLNACYVAEPTDRKISSGPVGAALCMLGFFLWNLDNIYCDSLRSMRTVILQWVYRRIPLPPTYAFVLGSVLGSPFQLHAWWHILMGIGSYQCIFYFQWRRFWRGFGPDPEKFGVKTVAGILSFFVPNSETEVSRSPRRKRKHV